MGQVLAAWANFYVITGTAAASLTGLTFVVIALLANAPRVNPRGLAGFVTPTVVHFCSVLALSALLSMPHTSVLALAIALGAAGVAGLVYAGATGFILWTSGPEYIPVWEDWIFHAVLPGVAYGGLLLAGILLPTWTGVGLNILAAASLILLFAGIHNAWDIAVWLSVHRISGSKQPGAVHDGSPEGPA